jgi:hypothetical protein
MGGLWAKPMELKGGAIGNTLREHNGNLGNLTRIHRELERNMLGIKEN